MTLYNRDKSCNLSTDIGFNDTGSSPFKRSGGRPKTPRTTPGHTSQSAATTTTTLEAKLKTGRTPKTPSTGNTPGGDRYIVHRGATDIERAHGEFTKAHRALNFSGKESDALSGDMENMQPDASGGQLQTPEKAKRAEQQRKLATLLGHASTGHILAFAKPPPRANNADRRTLTMLYSAAKSTTDSRHANSVHHIPSQPERILDAPQFLDDFYLNCVDWSENGLLAVALQQTVYLWDAQTGSIVEMPDLSDPTGNRANSSQNQPADSSFYVSSVRWIQRSAPVLAIGLSNGKVQLWDVTKSKLQRTLEGHAGRVAAMSWNHKILTSGSRTGMVHHTDVSARQHFIGSAQLHTHEVCSVQWDPNGDLLATGANDNLVFVSDRSQISCETTQPIAAVTEHQAAVKALSWCSWQRGLLASGGGTADRRLRITNVLVHDPANPAVQPANSTATWPAGTCVKSLDTGSQVSGVVWNERYSQIATSHGYAMNQVTIWKYPSLERVVDLPGHRERIISMIGSPDGQMLLTASADETIRLWRAFPDDKSDVACALFKGTTNERPRVIVDGSRVPSSTFPSFTALR